jgi:hypothetical protein
MNNSEILKTILSEIRTIKSDINEIKEDIVVMKQDIVVMKKDISGLKNEVLKFIKYTEIESKLYEKEITSWLYNYFITKYYSMFFYIPNKEEFPRDLIKVINDSEGNSKKNNSTLTDVDGIIIETDNYNEKEKCKIVNNHLLNSFLQNQQNQKQFYKKCVNQQSLKTTSDPFIYKLHIIESKHTLDIRKIKKKIKQIILLKKMFDSESCHPNLEKFKNSEIYLYFAAPTLKENVIHFIKKNIYKEESIWKNNRIKINIQDLDFLDKKIHFISYGTYDYYLD